MKSFDLIIIGAGPAGLTAALYAERYKIKTLLIGEQLGGWASEAVEIQNFPTYKSISGIEFSNKMKEQIDGLGAEMKYDRVIDIEKKDSYFLVRTSSDEYKAKKIILAKGSEKKKLELKNEDKLTGRGISYCATCDGAFYKNKVAAVVGGGNSALSSAVLLSRFAKLVYIIYRGESFAKADPAWVEEVKKNKKIKMMFNTNVTGIVGKNKLEKIKLDNGHELEMDGLFIEIGFVPSMALIDKLGIELEGSQIKVDNAQRTNVKGIFAAGDITNCPLKQIVVACGQGAIAANTAYKELTTNK